MEQMRNYQVSQEFIDDLTSSTQDERHAHQREVEQCEYREDENRAERRERERRERKIAKKVRA